MKQINKFQVKSIKKGTIIDHIPIKMGIKLLSLFELNNSSQNIIIGLNLPSVLIGYKDLIKINNTFINQDQVNQLAVYTPDATVNYIEEYKVISKITPSLPDFVKNIIICPNDNCISRSELKFSKFRIISKNKLSKYLKCIYCEREFARHLMSIK
ncbi:aspartate carbamoyltransferase regulatory subunit [Candidatus Pantoea edessiphila]|uniref:Aspartate carbamoyltransferase regulatory chain n=1 Tax=Candidatus Pantoea edessiphila TaxID=2044610 RepID=A0A2P5SY68_9GAMM|nr:aspartate carbamoyltransferase regulatory subunit [Candidatus Pantoea edessiphila]MBK4775629.1 aspartate carbamoyltransferase regulatory subunit [Pantoea sp. Edef]PPI87276.1 aspartate carbamoyltransferase regulatory subunit [Candidatus Pantoea edessiphila]